MATSPNVGAMLPRVIPDPQAQTAPAAKTPAVAAALTAIPWQAQYAKPGPYITTLPPQDEQKFQQWWNAYSSANPGMDDPNAPHAGYDYRGWFKAGQAGDPRAVQQVNPNDHRLHFNDAWKTPYHESFSGESIYAKPGGPTWNDKDQLIAPNGKVLFDERAKAKRTKGAK